jgi:four helix bundle protein
MPQSSNKYDLEERTAKLGENVIALCRTLEQSAITRPVISQIVRSATSVGANYMEANAASSKRDFRNKIHICKKESQETKHWLRMLANCFPERKDEIRKLWQESQELTLIFQKITHSLRQPTDTFENSTIENSLKIKN